jgi:hypothetical protein
MRNNETEVQIQNLFEICDREEKEWLVKSDNASEVVGQWLFGPRKFGFASESDVGNPLAWKSLYEDLVYELKAADDTRVWYLLGQFLNSTGIRDPITFFPKSILDKLRHDMAISVADIRNAELVRIWLPYTEPLMRKARWLKKAGSNVPKRLQDFGYDPDIVNLFTRREGEYKNWTSPVEFTCEWIATKSLGTDREFQRETLVNSYSRLYPKNSWSLIAKCAFCGEDSEDEFWAAGEAVLYCEDHTPDDLPEFQTSAREDRRGRRYWREGLEIRVAARS